MTMLEIRRAILVKITAAATAAVLVAGCGSDAPNVQSVVSLATA